MASADASAGDGPAYDLELHRGARRELYDLPVDARDTLTDAILAAGAQRQPATHDAVKKLRDATGLYRVRAGDYRAVCTLDKPTWYVLCIDERERVYDRLDVARRRARDAGLRL